MKRHIRTVLVAFTGAAVLLGLAGPAGAWGRHVSNVYTQAIATPGRTSVSDTEMVISHLTGPNAYVRATARARSAHCDGCDSTAASLHVVLVDGPIRSLNARSHATSVNQMCNNCTATAFSAQVIVGGAGPIRLTADARRVLAEIEAEVEGLQSHGDAAQSEMLRLTDLAAAIVMDPDNLERATTQRGAALALPRPDVRVLRDMDKS